MSDATFSCPRCGGRYFGRDTERDAQGRIVVLATVRCHCDQHGRRAFNKRP